MLAVDSNANNSIILEKPGHAVGPLEKGLIINGEKRSTSIIITLLRFKSRVPLDPEMARKALILLAQRYPLLRVKIVKKTHNGGPVKEYFMEVDDPSEIKFEVVKDFSADDLEAVIERESADVPLDFNFGHLWRAILSFHS